MSVEEAAPAQGGEIVGELNTLEEAAEPVEVSEPDAKYADFTLLQVAERGMMELVDMCVMRGEELDQTDAHGTTPLMAAVQQQHPEMVEYLLSRSSYPNARRLNGETAMHLAARAGHKPILQLLLNNGGAASIEVEAEGRNRPLHLAAHGNHEECVHLLLERGAIVACKNEVGQTPLTSTFSSNIKNWLQSVQQGGESARLKLRQDTSEVEVAYMQAEKKQNAERELAEKYRRDQEEAERLESIRQADQMLVDDQTDLQKEIEFLKSEVNRHQAEEVERERQRAEQEELDRIAAEKAAKKKGKGGKKK